MRELPVIIYDGVRYTYDYRLHQLRAKTKEGGLSFINLNTQENELLAYAIDHRKEHPELVRKNMKDLEWKLNSKGLEKVI